MKNSSLIINGDEKLVSISSKLVVRFLNQLLSEYIMNPESIGLDSWINSAKTYSVDKFNSYTEICFSTDKGVFVYSNLHANDLSCSNSYGFKKIDLKEEKVYKCFKEGKAMLNCNF